MLHFKQEWQYLRNTRLLKLLLGTTNLKINLNVICVIFDFRNIAIACCLKSFTKHSMAIFGLVYPKLEKYKKSMLAQRVLAGLSQMSSAL